MAVTLVSVALPFLLLCCTGNEELIHKFAMPFLNCTDGSIRGCWGITEPNHGSDQLFIGDEILSRPGVKGDVRATEDGDGYLINGQKSAWVSSATNFDSCHRSSPVW